MKTSLQLLGFWLILVSPVPGFAGGLQAPAGPMCEWHQGISTVKDVCPEFYWEAAGQTAYQVVTYDMESPDKPIWDSGKVPSSLPIAEYSGSPLKTDKRYRWKARVWRGDEVPSPFSEFAEFRTSFSEMPHRLPHIRTFINFGVRGKNAEDIARRYDLNWGVLSDEVVARLREANPDFININYILAETMCVPSDKATELEKFCIERGLTKSGIAEDMFMHFREDRDVTLPIQPEQPSETRTVPGWDPRNDKNGDGKIDDKEFAERVNQKASARCKKDARVPVYFWPEPRGDYLTNFGNPTYQQFLAEVHFKPRVGAAQGLAIDSTWPRPSASASGAELLEFARDTDVWRRNAQMMLAKIKIAVPDAIVVGNGWWPNEPDEPPLKPFVIDGCQWEGWFNVRSSGKRIEQRIATAADLERRGKIQLIEYRTLWNDSRVEPPIDKDRDCIFCLATYYLVHGGHTYLGIYCTETSYKSHRKDWFGAIEYDIGRPVGPYYVFAESKGEVPPGNLLKNGDFEQDADGDGNPDGWIPAEPVEIAHDEKVSGKSSARISSDSPAINNINKQYVTLKPNTSYTLCGWIKVKDVKGSPGAQIYPHEFEGTNTGAVMSSMTVAGTTDWKFYKGVFKTNEDSAGRINFRVYHAVGTAWFDDIRLVEGAYYDWKILARKFERALILVKLGDAGYGSAPMIHQLDRHYRPLRADGSLGEPTRKLSLCCNEAAILVMD